MVKKIFNPIDKTVAFRDMMGFGRSAQVGFIGQGLTVAKGRVLLIDDEEELLEITQELLGEYHECITRLDARKALELFEKGEKFDCIFCDLMMPKMNGVSFYEGLKKISPIHLSKIIFMTGGSYNLETTQLLSHSEVRFCEKPIRFEQLLDLVQNTMINSRKSEYQ